MHKRTSRALACAGAVAALTGGMLTAGTNSAAAAPSGLQGDFNGDGYRDIAVSAPHAKVDGKAKAGQIVVLYGSPEGPAAATRTVISQNTAGVPDKAEAGDVFGATTAAGDLNGDGYADLAVTAPYEKVGKDTEGGTVMVLWGSAKGLSGGTRIPDPTPDTHDRFGRTVAVGDFNGDGKPDLAVGSSSSAIDVYKGGLTKAGGTEGRYTVKASAIINGGKYGGPLNLTPGDVNGDGSADLVVDGYDKDEGYNTNYYLPGSTKGLTAKGGKPLPSGVITSIGDLDKNGYGDIVIGLSWDPPGVPGSTRGGKVNIINGSAKGPAKGVSYSISQNTHLVPGTSEKGDYFGAELSLGDVNGDGYLDLAVTAPGEKLEGIDDTGAVTVVYGSSEGLTGTGAHYFSQDAAGVPNTNEADDLFGSDVHLADLTGDGKADLTVGASGENAGNGSVTFLKSDGARITGAGALGFGTSDVGVSAAGKPLFGVNFAG